MKDGNMRPNDISGSILTSVMEVNDPKKENELLLAHYTSLRTFENIITKEEIWFSTPLYMNDCQEVTFALARIVDGIREYLVLHNIIDKEKYKDFFSKMLWAYDYVKKELLCNTYIFCLSEHTNDDGLLSMWRGYGNDGNGIALVLNAKKFPVPSQPLFYINKVGYKNIDCIKKDVEKIMRTLLPYFQKYNADEIGADDLLLGIFDGLALYSLFSKHAGFAEEKEWRLAHIKKAMRVHQNIIDPMEDYLITQNRIEPKLKFNYCEAMEELEFPPFSALIEKIIIGPCVNGEIAKNMVVKMLEKNQKKDLVEKVYISQIPYRGK